MTIQARKLVRRLIPALTTDWRKGQHGRVGVVGGSFEYTGAPYYAGISCLKTGADLCHLFCTEEAAIPIKSYSPELIVHPLLRSDNSLKGLEASERDQVLHAAVEKISDVFSRLDTLVIGPGLGRDAGVQEITRQLIQRAKSASLPLVLDGDALFLISLEPDVIRGYTHAILTPNAMEYARLCVSIGLLDEVDPAKAAKIHPTQLSQTALEAFDLHQRSMTSPDVLQSIGKGFLLSFACATDHEDKTPSMDVTMVDEAAIAENEKELAGFASGSVTSISPVLERVLEEIRATGIAYYQWAHLKPLLMAKLQVAMDQVAAADPNAPTVGVGWSPTNKNSASERRATITELLNTFDGPPFTLQRLTEVIMEPLKSYKTLNKLINALEKLLAVSTTIQVVDPRAAPPPSAADPAPVPDATLPAPLPVQVVAEGDVVARAPWSNSDGSSQ
ncbi:Yjef family domain-containing protein, variant 2, partial [Globisporangium splendens]